MSQPTFEGIWKSVLPKKGYIENEINLRFLGSKQSLPYCKRVPLINLELSVHTTISCHCIYKHGLVVDKVYLTYTDAKVFSLAI